MFECGLVCDELLVCKHQTLSFWLELLTRHQPAGKEVIRRDRLRAHHRLEYAAIVIQRKFRLRFARERLRAIKVAVRLEQDRAKREKEKLLSLRWYDERAPEYTGPHKYEVQSNDGKITITGDDSPA